MATHGNIYHYTSAQMLSLRNSPLVQRPEGMPSHAEIFEVRGKVIPLRHNRSADIIKGTAVRTGSIAYTAAGSFTNKTQTRPHSTTLSTTAAQLAGIPAKPSPSKSQSRDYNNHFSGGGRNPVRRSEPGAGPDLENSSKYIPSKPTNSSRSEPEWMSFSVTPDGPNLVENDNINTNAVSSTAVDSGTDEFQKFKAMMKSQQIDASRNAMNNNINANNNTTATSRMNNIKPLNSKSNGPVSYAGGAHLDTSVSSLCFMNSNSSPKDPTMRLQSDLASDAARMLYSEDQTARPHITTKRRSRFERLFDEEPLSSSSSSISQSSGLSGLQHVALPQPSIPEYPYMSSQDLPHIISEEEAMRAILAGQNNNFKPSRSTLESPLTDASNLRLNEYPNESPSSTLSLAATQWNSAPTGQQTSNSMPFSVALSEEEVLERMGVRVSRKNWRKSTQEEDKKSMERIIATLTAASLSQTANPALPIFQESQNSFMFNSADPLTVQPPFSHQQPNQNILPPSQQHLSQFSSELAGNHIPLNHDQANTDAVFSSNTIRPDLFVNQESARGGLNGSFFDRHQAFPPYLAPPPPQQSFDMLSHPMYNQPSGFSRNPPPSLMHSTPFHLNEQVQPGFNHRFDSFNHNQTPLPHGAFSSHYSMAGAFDQPPYFQPFNPSQHSMPLQPDQNQGQLPFEQHRQ
ncbi:hypothetical protein BDV3_006034 [Batrachochytrium dendrobatidis]|uniref:Uncharacterized protein n=1 Tax=Batrachochytrium dendrobatidis (strain JEL423) TaxID=403673 RepID=A0A177WP86_BATDL|nr:hypothetical protein BDEG_24811 [Batrachochytrium dendrobatidis JEL423]